MQHDKVARYLSYPTLRLDKLSVRTPAASGRRFRLIRIRGGKWSIEGYEAFEGRARFKRWLTSQPAVMADLEEEIRAAAEVDGTEAEAEETEPA
jgi:hypothetical protein